MLLMLTWDCFCKFYEPKNFYIYDKLTAICTIECRAPSSSSNVLETVSGITTQSLSMESAIIVDKLLDSLKSEMPTEM
jgi:hypothetical protein